MKKLLLGMALCALCTGAQAREYWLKSATADWSQAASFTVDSATGADATVPPGSADEVHLPATEVTLTAGTASFTTAAGVNRIIPEADSRLVLTVNNVEEGVENIVDFAAAVNAGDETPQGVVVKEGTGSLRLKSTASGKCYYTSFSVQSGVLYLSAPATHTYFGDLTMADGATVSLPSSSNYSRFRAINGSSGALITCQGGTPYLYLEAVSTTYPTSCYAGKIDSTVQIIANGLLRLTNAESTYSGLVQVYNQYNVPTYGTIETTQFGLAGQASPLGSNAAFDFSYCGGGYRYVGTADSTTDKEIGIIQASPGYVHFLDAGAHGGVTFTGNWKYMHTSGTSMMDNFVLTGSNAVPCVIAGEITDWYRIFGVHHTDRPVYFTKKGSGAWKFTDAACGSEGSSWFYGGFNVAGGALQFTSIADVGKKCSLGYATFLTREMTGVATADDMRDYAYTIGTTDSGKEAVFEYVGDTPSVSTNRKAVIVGTGTIRSSATGTGWLGLRGISARDAAGATLVLDGTNANGNVASDVSNGAGPLSVVKRGTGTWALSGNQTFTGSLTVEEGVLEVIAPKYTWFRFTVKETGTPSKNPGQTVFRQLALYDKDGVRQDLGLLAVLPQLDTGTWYRTQPDYRTLAEGYVQWGNNAQHAYPEAQYLDLLFSDTTDRSTFSGHVHTGAFDKDNENTWLPIVLRLPSDRQEVVRWDYVTWYTGISERWPKLVTMEGSTDGMNWDLLDDRDVDVEAANSKVSCWVSDLSDFSDGQTRKDCGFALSAGHTAAKVLEGVSTVKVASGATLRTHGGTIKIPNLEVDVNDCGVVDGFSFAESGTLKVTSDGSTGAIDLPDFLTNASDVENLTGWSLVLDGKAKPNWKIAVKNGRVSLVPPGLSIILR